MVLFIIHWFVVYIEYGRGHLGFTIVCSLTFLSFYLIAKALQFLLVVVYLLFLSAAKLVVFILRLIYIYMKIYETCVQTFVLCVAMLFFSNSPATVGPAILSFIASTDYVDCLRLAISLGGDSDTLAAIAGPMAYAYYKEMPDPLVYQALKSLPDWMQRTNAAFDQRCEEIGALG